MDISRSANVSALRRAASATAIALTAGAISLAGALPGIAHANDDLIVKYDQSQLLRLSRPAAEIIIGNPSIADVSVQGGNLLVITGKTFGITNIIALDGEKNIIQDQRVIVKKDDRRIVNLHKGSVRQSYSCTPECQTTLTIGDEAAYYESVAKASERKAKLSEGGSEPSGAQ